MELLKWCNKGYNQKYLALYMGNLIRKLTTDRTKEKSNMAYVVKKKTMFYPIVEEKAAR